MVLIPIPDNFLYLGFLFALLFCILNSSLGVFIFIWSVLLTKSESKNNLNLTQLNPGSSNTEAFDFRKKIVMNENKLSLVRFGRNLKNQ